MTTIINGVVGIIIGFIFLCGVFCNWVVKKKYEKMLATMKNKGRDKHLLMIERDYRHEYLKERVERIKVFIDRSYYGIKLCNIPLYGFEDFTLSSVYFVGLLGLTFTVIQLALPHQSFQAEMGYIIFLSIEGLICGLVLMLLRTFLCIPSQKEIFKANLCNYLEYELELFDEAERDEEGRLFFHKDYKEDKAPSQNRASNNPIFEFRGNDRVRVPNGRKDHQESLESAFNDHDLLQFLEELMG